MEDDQLNEQQPEISFDDVIVSLRDEENPFPARYLYRLSGLEGEELGLVSRVWFDLSTERRLGLLEDLETLSESNTVMNFDAVNRFALGDADARVRQTAIRALWPSEQVSLVPNLVELMEKDESPEVRAQAASALGRFVYLGELGNIPQAIQKEAELHLLKTLDSDPDALVKRRALESIGYSSRPEVPDLIEQAYEKDDDEWIGSALFAMGRSADDRWTPLVIERLKDPSSELSREAARAAGELELGDAVPSLIELLQEEDQDLRLAAAWSLSQIGGTDAEDALQELLERTEDEDEIDLIEDALENLAFTHEMADMNILDFSPEEIDEMTHPELDGDEPEEE